MSKFTESLTLIFQVFVILFISATLGGTIVYYTYSSVHELFPLALSSGILPATLGWWTCVKLVWLIATIFRPTTPSNNGKTVYLPSKTETKDKKLDK